MPEQDAQQQPATQKRGGDTVVVACKMPGGLLLRVFRFEDYDEPVLGGGTKTAKRSIQIGEPVKINGNAVALGKTPRHAIVLPGGSDPEQGAPFTDGYALTPGVPRDFWERWLEQNKDSDIVRNGLIKASPTTERAQSQALDDAKRRSGLEPLAQEKDPRAPRRITKGDRREAA